MTSVQLHKHLFEVLAYGPNAVLLRPMEQSSELNCPALAAQLYHLKVKGLKEVIASKKDIVLLIAPGRKTSVLKVLTKHPLLQIPFSSDQVKNDVAHKFPICFEKGLDWDFVETQTSKTKTAIINHLQATPFQMAMYGFIPGFLYMDGLPNELHCSRKNDPRQEVPAGAIGIGGPYLGCYGLSSPGGWQIIGQSPLVFFDKHKMPPTLVAINDRLQIEIINESLFDQLKKQSLTLKQYNRAAY